MSRKSIPIQGLGLAQGTPNPKSYPIWPRLGPGAKPGAPWHTSLRPKPKKYLRALPRKFASSQIVSLRREKIWVDNPWPAGSFVFVVVAPPHGSSWARGPKIIGRASIYRPCFAQIWVFGLLRNHIIFPQFLILQWFTLRIFLNQIWILDL